MSDLSLLPRDTTVSAVTPFVPLSLAYSGLSPAQLVSIGRAHWKLTALIVLLVLGIAATAVLLWPRAYGAATTLMVSYEVNDPNNGKSLPSMQTSNYISTQIELLSSPEVLRAVVDRLNLTQDPEYARGHRADRGTLRDWVAAKVSKDLAIFQRQPGSQLIHIVFSAPDRVRAAEVANTVAAVYKEQDALRSPSSPAERARQSALRLQALKTEVDLAQTELTRFHQDHAVIDEGNKNNVDVILLAGQEARLLEAQTTRRVAESLAAEDPASGTQVLASGQTQSLKGQIAAQELHLALLNRVYTPLYPDVVEANLRLQETRRSLASAIKGYADNAQTSLVTARRVEQTLQQSVLEQRNKVLARGQLQDRAAKYQLAVESAQAQHRRALEGHDLITLAGTGQGSNVSVVSVATPPVGASNSKALVGAVLGTLFAALLGLGIPQIYERFHRRVRCRDDLERHQGIPVLAEFSRLPLRTLA